MPCHPAPALVCVDFDDTLVASQAHFAQAAADLAALLQREVGAAAGDVRAVFERLDSAHHHLGRHRNRFLLTVVGTYAALAGRDLPLRLLPELARIAAHPYDAPIAPHAGVPAALRRLSHAFPAHVWCLTAGDPVVQPGRVARAGLARYFDRVCVVAEKTVEVFRQVGDGHARRVMIGNSPRTDIVPALAAGFEAWHVQAPTWVVDDGALPAGVPSCITFVEAVDRLLGTDG